MAEKPILFNGEMVRAILDHKKTMTRRAVTGVEQGKIEFDGCDYWYEDKYGQQRELLHACPYGRPFDYLWVRETFAPVEPCDWNGHIVECPEVKYWPFHPEDWHLGERQMGLAYRADGEADDQLLEGGKWRPSIHMPRWASRLTLRVMDVRVERLQDITQADAKAEGAPYWWLAADGIREMSNGVEFSGENVPEEKRDYVRGFRELWNEINGKRGYFWPDEDLPENLQTGHGRVMNGNPLLWVVEFEVCP